MPTLLLFVLSGQRSREWWEKGMDYRDLLIVGVPALIVLWLGREFWKAREDYWGVKAGFMIVIICVAVAGGYLYTNRHSLKQGQLPLLDHPIVKKFKAMLNG